MVIIRRTPGANILDVIDRVKGLLPELAASIPPASTSTSRSIGRRRSEPRCTTSSARSRSRSRSSCSSCSLFLRSRPRDVDPGRRRAAGVGRDVRRDVLARLQPRQPVADGTDDRDRIRRRRCDRRDRERHAPHRERRVAARAALDGAREIGFTIVSITTSLIAVFIPLLFMGGVVGRLFREFAVVLTIAIACRRCSR